MRASQEVWHSHAARTTLEFTLAVLCVCATAPFASAALATPSPALHNTHNVVNTDGTSTLTAEPNVRGEDATVSDQEMVVLPSDGCASSMQPSKMTRTTAPTTITTEPTSHSDAGRRDTSGTSGSSSSPSSIDWPIMVRADNLADDGSIAPPGSEFGAPERKFTFASSEEDATGSSLPATFTVTVEQEWATKGLSCVVWHASELLARHIHTLGVNQSNMLVRIDVVVHACRQSEVAVVHISQSVHCRVVVISCQTCTA